MIESQKSDSQAPFDFLSKNNMNKKPFIQSPN